MKSFTVTGDEAVVLHIILGLVKDECDHTLDDPIHEHLTKAGYDALVTLIDRLAKMPVVKEAVAADAARLAEIERLEKLPADELLALGWEIESDRDNCTLWKHPETDEYLFQAAKKEVAAS